MRLSLAVLIALVAVSPRAAEQSWEVRGEFVAIKAGDPEVVVLRLAGGRTIELPVESLSPAGQAAARKQPAATDEGGSPTVVTVRGPFGRMIQVSVPDSIKDVEADAMHCCSASEAADVYRLFLAGDRPAPAQRQAADTRLKEWAAMADQGLVRLGDRWVPSPEARAAADEATKVVDHALELMRLGNADLAEEELRKASRIDPESGQASFIMGLSYALVAKNPAKAVEHFVDAVHRDPDNGSALANVATLEIVTRRYAAVAAHFREAMAQAADPLPVAENIAWALRLAGAAKTNPALAKNRLPEKTVEELNTLYRTLTQALKLKPAETSAAPWYLGPNGLSCSAATVADVAKLFESRSTMRSEPRHALGFAVGSDCIVCPREAVVGSDGTVFDDIAVMTFGENGRRLVATVVAAPKDGAVALLKCEDLAAEPIPLAAIAPPKAEIAAIDRADDSWLAVRPKAARGKVVEQATAAAGGRFIHAAVVPRGHGGGPIVDATGRVVGMVAATPRTDASGNAAGFGVPVERILAGLEEHLPRDVVAEAKSDADIAAAERRACAGTVLVSAARVGPESRATEPAPRP